MPYLVLILPCSHLANISLHSVLVVLENCFAVVVVVVVVVVVSKKMATPCVMQCSAVVLCSLV